MATSIPKTMKGVIIEKTGGIDVLEYRTNLPVPEPKEGEILVKNEYIGINYIATNQTRKTLTTRAPDQLLSQVLPQTHFPHNSYFRSGLYPSPKPEILGREASGTIASLGPSSHSSSFSVGDRVVWMGTSGYAEYTATPADKAIKIPSQISLADACAAILQGLTAITLVEEAHKVEKGDWVLVHAAAGGVGLWLCQVLRAKGARTIATASSEEKRALAKENGAEVVAGYDKDEVLEAVKKHTAGEGVRVAFDGVGKATFDLSLETVARKGSMVSFGNASGAVEPFTISRLTAKNIKIARPTLFNYVHTRDEFERYSNELFDMMIHDKFNVRIHEIYTLAEVRRATEDIEGRKTTGKLLMRP